MKFLRKFVPKFLIFWYHFCLAFFGAFLYGFPAYKLKVIGVTGTNGKSTTVDMITRIFNEAGYATASLSSVRFQIRDKEFRNTLKMTMPGRFFIQGFLRKAVQAGCKYAVVEVTSEGIMQHRHRFLNFHTAVLTNLSPEHIERHGSFEKYREAKGKLFQMVKKAHVINSDDQNKGYFSAFPSISNFQFSISNQFSKNPNFQILNAEDIKETENGVNFRVDSMNFNLKLLGKFNVSNALAALCVAKSFGISLDIAKRALEKMEGVPGRMEEVIKQPMRVIVDYAFTPAALEKVYQALKTTNYKLVCVLGAAGGGRDKWKRPVLGKIAGEYCDTIIITNEDPYEEDPQKIIDEVAAGAESISINQQNRHESALYKVLDRREAIRKGLSLASSGDTVIITGKGSEDSIAVAGGKKIPWDDREAVREEFQKMDKIK